MRNAALTATIALAALILLAPSGGAQDGVLLSDNGLGNVQFSEYGDAPRHITGGSYTTNPALATAQGKTTFSFSEGAEASFLGVQVLASVRQAPLSRFAYIGLWSVLGRRNENESWRTRGGQ